MFGNFLNVSRRISTLTQKFNGIKCGDLIYDTLKYNNVKHVWCVSGGAIMPVIDAFHKKSDIKYFVNTHEQNAGHAATGYAKSSGRTGVVIVTSGPGITNLITPMLDATNDSTPLVVISGQVPKKVMGSLAFQECSATEITKPVTKWSYCIQNIDEIPFVMNLAFQIANDGKKGAVHLDLPKCISSSVYNHREYSNSYFIKFANNILKITQQSTPDYQYIKEIADVINTSKRALIIVGRGCVDYADKLREFAIKSNIPVTSTLHGMGIFDETHELSLKMCGMHGSAFSNFSIQNADCVIALGSRFDDRTTGNIEKYAPNAKNIIHVNINDKEINNIVHCNYTVLLDCERFLNIIIPMIKFNKRELWIKYINKLKVKYPLTYNKTYPDIKTQSVLVELNKQTSDMNNVIFTMGVGNHMMMACQFIQWRRPKQVIASGSLGVMGCSNGYAMGAKIANPDHMVISIDGDGSFNMTSNELKTIAEYNIPIKVAIMNDESLQMVKIWEELFFDGRVTATDNKNPSYTKLADAYGIKNLYCDSYDTLTDIINEFLNYEGPIICEFKVKKDICLPLVKPGKALDDMILFNDYHNNIKLKGETPN